MLHKDKLCAGCPLFMAPNSGFSMPEGKCTNGVLIIGEALGQKEYMAGLPLRPDAESGSVLQTVFRRLGVDRSEFLLWNLIACRPPNNLLENMPYEREAIMHCRVHFQNVLQANYGKIKCILALGNLPLRYLCPEIEELYNAAKADKNKKQLKKLGSTSLRGYAFNSILGIPIVSTIHPSFIARGERLLLHVLKRDVYFAMQVAKTGIPKFQTNYIIDPSDNEVNEFYNYCRKNPNLAISYDIETPYTRIETDETEIEYEGQDIRDIDSIQFSMEAGKGIFLDWNKYNEAAASILKLPNQKLSWNGWKFDETHIEYHLGKGAINGQSLDMMWCLNANTKVKLASGKYKSIKEIVNNKKRVHVLTLNDNGEIVPTKIIDWHKHQAPKQDWIRVTSTISRFPLYLTPEHEVITLEGRTEAQFLKEGMHTLLSSGGADDVIHGCLLGDSWFNRKTGHLNFIHGKDQEIYADHKFNYFDIWKNHHIDNNGYKRLYGSVRCSNKWGNIFYTKTGKIFVPPPTNRALAVWYMDDGNLNDANPSRKNPYYVARFSVMGFENQQETFEWFKNEFGPTNVSQYKASNGIMIVLSGNALHKLMQRIAEFIPECMSHKLLPEYCNRYNGWFEKRESQVATIIGIKRGRNVVASEKDTRYCITVENNSHTFFAMGGLIANCWKHANPDFVKTGRALQFATNFFAPEFPAWKHKSEVDPKNYGCLDVDAVVRINNGLSTALKNKRLLPNTKSLYEGYIDDIVNLRPILKDMTDRGLPIDIEAREEMRKMLVSEIRKANRELQELYPFELRNPSPKLGYKYVPKEIDELTDKFNNKFRKISSNGHQSDYTIFGDVDTYNLYLSRFIEQNSRIRTSKKRDGTVVEKPVETTGLICKEFLIDGVKEKRWCRVEKFKAGSREQVIAYIKYKGYKVPTTKDFRKGNKDTTTKDVISQLADEHGDRIFNLIVYLRELRKLKSTYVDSKRKGWILGRDNRIHADFLPIPATGQLSSKIHNAPARGTRFSSEGYKQLANQFRKTIAAGPGKLLLSGDWSSFHALTLGFEAEDKEYCRLVRLDVHSYVASYILASELPDRYKKLKWKKPDKLSNEEWIAKCTKYEECLNRISNLDQWLNLPDDQLREQLKWIKKNFEFTRNSQAKPAILGMGFGMREHKFYKLNRHSFKDIKSCENLISTIRKLFPLTFDKFHRDILERADRDEYLISRYGYIRWFNDVYDWRMITGPPKTIRHGERLVRNKGRLYHVKLGADSNKCIAFLPANDAFGFKKETMRALWSYIGKDNILRNLVKEYGLINEIHDDLMFEVPEDKVEEAAKIIKEVMERPAKYLKNSIAPEGLVVKVELKQGRNWGEMSEIKL